jgi:hypothetical protein
MRSTLDKLVSWTGLLLAAVLLVAGGLLTWASAFISNEVHHQLAIQDITMPSGDAITSLPDKADQDALGKYAGQALLKGPQAKAYADHYILAHLNEAGAGESYSTISSKQMSACTADASSDDCAKYTGLKNTFFQGDTLRGLLLYGYAFATVGTIAGYAAIGAYTSAVVFLLLGILGLLHARRLRAATV